MAADLGLELDGRRDAAVLEQLKGQMPGIPNIPPRYSCTTGMERLNWSINRRIWPWCM